jgi:hypothetical protein
MSGIMPLSPDEGWSQPGSWSAPRTGRRAVLQRPFDRSGPGFRGRAAAVDLHAGTRRHVNPGIACGGCPGFTGAGMGRSLAVVLACSGNAEAFLRFELRSRRRSRIRRHRQRRRGGDSGGDEHGRLHTDLHRKRSPRSAAHYRGSANHFSARIETAVQSSGGGDARYIRQRSTNICDGRSSPRMAIALSNSSIASIQSRRA